MRLNEKGQHYQSLIHFNILYHIKAGNTTYIGKCEYFRQHILFLHYAEFCGLWLLFREIRELYAKRIHIMTSHP